MAEFDAHACTDVTGFGLMGHLKSMAAASRVDVEIVWDDVPLLPGVLEVAADGILPGAVERNKESSADALAAVEGVEPAGVEILFDAQTSGGLLIALPESAAAGFVARLHAEGMPRRRSSAAWWPKGPGGSSSAAKAGAGWPMDPLRIPASHSNQHPIPRRPVA